MVRIPAADKSIKAPGPLALVTGASSGIGEVFARTLSAKGYRVILVARRKERLEKLAAELPGAEALSADLTRDSDLDKVERRIASEPQLDFLVNNAGFGIPGCYFKTDVDAQNRMHQLHILAIGRLTHAALRGMVERGRGSIINVSSMAGFIQAPFSVSYNATKAWINSFTEGLYLELKAIGSPVRVQALCPGFTYTEFQKIAGIDQSTIPKSLWMSAEFVVDASLRGLERNKLFVVPGWRYRLGLAAIRLLPQSLIHYYAMKYGRHRNQSGLGSNTQALSEKSNR
ncbi:MAG: SDR family oxidoreductase [Acidobacteriota bacterium]|nr:SDR family oxidoreductase [Acidobacteriota bacterium]